MKQKVTVPRVGSRLKLEYLYSGAALYQPGETLDERFPRLMKDFEGVLIVEGHPTYETQYGRYPLEPGSIVLARPGLHETCLWDADNQTYHAYFHFNLEEVPADWPAVDEWPYCLIHPPQVLAELFRHIVDQSTQRVDWPGQQSPGGSENRQVESFLDIFLNPPRPSSDAMYLEFSEPVRRALKSMCERFEDAVFQPVNLEDLAAASHVSSKHLCRMFRKELNLSPMRVCRLMQFQLAIAMLARSNRNVQDIARRCGFPDPFYFSRSFTKTFGKSPSQLRLDVQNGAPLPKNPLPHSHSLMPRLHW